MFFCLFLMVTLVCLRSVIVLFPGHTHLLLSYTDFSVLLSRKTTLENIYCVVTVSVLFLFLAVTFVGLWSVIVVFPGHTRLLSVIY